MPRTQANLAPCALARLRRIAPLPGARWPIPDHLPLVRVLALSDAHADALEHVARQTGVRAPGHASHRTFAGRP
ncbi:MAG: hypothetical protein RBS39_03345 [Phycisphaerales bacterium]|nr:hypothetical protein [Phycisphaerales bacterium]